VLLYVPRRLLSLLLPRLHVELRSLLLSTAYSMSLLLLSMSLPLPKMTLQVLFHGVSMSAIGVASVTPRQFVSAMHRYAMPRLMLWLPISMLKTVLPPSLWMFLPTIGSWPLVSVTPMPLLPSPLLTRATVLRLSITLWMHLRGSLRLPPPVGLSTSRSMTTTTLPGMLTIRVLTLSSLVNNNEISFPLPTSTMLHALKPDVRLLDMLMLLLLKTSPLLQT
jgi:hypothetical protein